MDDNTIPFEFKYPEVPLYKWQSFNHGDVITSQQEIEKLKWGKATVEDIEKFVIKHGKLLNFIDQTEATQPYIDSVLYGLLFSTIFE